MPLQKVVAVLRVGVMDKQRVPHASRVVRGRLPHFAFTAFCMSTISFCR
jgi:hypothetical protein